MSDIAQKIEQFRLENPQVNEHSIQLLVKEVAGNCMQSIVNNEEFNGIASGAWWTIMETFEVEVKDMDQMLLINRVAPDNVQADFSTACSMQDIEGIKFGLSKGCRINKDNETSVLTDAIMCGNLETLKFFIENDFINKNPLHKLQVGFQEVKGNLFTWAYFVKQTDILRYLINEHNAENTLEAKEKLKEDTTEFKNHIINIIQNKYLNYILEVTIEDKPQVKNKLKI